MNRLVTSTRFLISWISLTVVGLITVLLGSLAVIIGFLFVSRILINVVGLSDLLLRGLYVAVIILMAVVIGGIIGGLQRGALRRKFPVYFTGWVRSSIVGSAGGLLIGSLIFLFSLDHIRINNIETLTLPDQRFALFMILAPVILPVVGMGIGQSFVLGRYVRAAWLWALAYIVSILAFMVLMGAGFLAIGTAILPIIYWVFALIAPGIITGFAVLFLMLASGHGD